MSSHDKIYIQQNTGNRMKQWLLHSWCSEIESDKTEIDPEYQTAMLFTYNSLHFASKVRMNLVVLAQIGPSLII